VYYMSMEFLMGRSLLNALYNLQISGQYTHVGPKLQHKDKPGSQLTHTAGRAILHPYLHNANVRSVWGIC